MTHSQASDAESSTWTAIPRVAEGNVRKFILAVIAVTALACGGGSDKSTGPNAAVAGTYTLRTINGQILPVIIDQLSAAPAYRLFVRRSSARWLAEWLIDAAEEFRLG